MGVVKSVETKNEWRGTYKQFLEEAGVPSWTNVSIINGKGEKLDQEDRITVTWGTVTDGNEEAQCTIPDDYGIE